MSDRASRPIELHSFAGGQPPPDLAVRLNAVAALPATAQQSLSEVLEPNLGATIDDAVEPLVQRFCAEHGVGQDALAPVVSGCRQLFRVAAGLDVGVEQMADDLGKLCDDTETARVLLACYARASIAIRSRTVLDLLHEYGPVLEDVRIRLDYVPVTRHDPAKIVPVAFMSLRYRDDETREHLALQVPPEQLAKLKSMCDALIASGPS